MRAEKDLDSLEGVRTLSLRTGSIQRGSGFRRLTSRAYTRKRRIGVHEMTRHSGISIDDDGVTLVIASESTGAGGTEVAFAPALLVLGSDGHPVAGRRARRLAAAGTGAAFADYTLRVGDPVPVIASDGSARGAADLVALTITCLLRDQATPQGPDQHLTIAHPNGWGGYQLAELRSALGRAGLDGLPTAFVPRATAAMRAIGATRADALVVAELGRHRTEITTLRGAGVDAVRTDDLGSAALDQAVLSHVLGQLAGEPSDRDDLIARCRAARRELTAGPATAVEVATNRGIERIRVTRGEFEESIRESVSITTSNICNALVDAVEKGATTYDVIIVGEGADVPLLSQTLSAGAGFGPGVEVGTTTAATGAALMAGDRAKAARTARQRRAATPADAPAAERPRPVSAPSLPKAALVPPAAERPSPDPVAPIATRVRPPVRPEPAAYQVPRPAETHRSDWPAAPAQRSGGRIRTAIVAAAAGLAVLVGGVAVTGGGGHGGGGGYHSHF